MQKCNAECLEWDNYRRVYFVDDIFVEEWWMWLISNQKSFNIVDKTTSNKLTLLFLPTKFFVAFWAKPTLLSSEDFLRPSNYRHVSCHSCPFILIECLIDDIRKLPILHHFYFGIFRYSQAIFLCLVLCGYFDLCQLLVLFIFDLWHVFSGWITERATIDR